MLNRNIKTRKALLTAGSLLFVLPGCRGNSVSPAAPSTAAAPTARVQVELWTVTYTPVSITGAACGFEISSGSATEPMIVLLSPQTVDFRPGDPQSWEPIDFFEYTGPRNGANFIARQRYSPYVTACGTTTTETAVTGTFSDDGSHLTAQQVDSIAVNDAHVVRIYSWSADRQK